MRATLMTLCPEVRQAIWSYCTTEDLANVACCSKSCHEVVNCFLWRSVNIDWKCLESRSLVKKKTRNLNYTTRLSFTCKEQCKVNATTSILSSLMYVFENCKLKQISSIKLSGLNNFCEETSNQFKYSINQTLHRLFHRVVGNCSYLSKLGFRKTYVSDDTMEMLVKLENLEHLELILCDGLTTTGMEHLTAMTKLRKLSVCVKEGSSDVPFGTKSNMHAKIIGKLVDLVELSLAGNYLIGDKCLEDMILSLVNLEVLNLHGCPYHCYSLIATLKKLRVLDLGAWSMGMLLEENFIDISEIFSVKVLNLEGNIFLANELYFPPFLVKLNLCHCNDLDDKLLATSFDDLVLLEELDISNCNKVTDVGLKFVSELNSLQRLNMFACVNVTDSVLKYFSSNVIVEKVNRCTKKLYDDIVML